MVKNMSLSWPMHEGNKDGVDLWSWLKLKYESGAKLDLLRRFYGEKISSLKLKSGGSIGYSRGWQFCGKKWKLLFNRNIGSLLKWLNRLKTRSSPDPARVLIIGINSSARFVMRQLSCMLIRSVKLPPRLRRRPKTR